MSKREAGPYDDIIRLPHHVSETRPRMSMADRAAQFSPFAALTGYGAELRETARLTDRKIELDEDAKAEIDRKLAALAATGHPVITVTYFLPDERKAGGIYVSCTGVLKRIEETERRLVLADGTAVPIGDLLDIEGQV